MAGHAWTDEYRNGYPTGWMIREDGWRLSRGHFEEETTASLAEEGLDKESAPSDKVQEADRFILAIVDELIDSGDIEGDIRVARQQGTLCAPDEIPNSAVMAAWLADARGEQ